VREVGNKIECNNMHGEKIKISTDYFKHAAHSLFFCSKCRLFHNANFLGSCIIDILHTGVLKFKCETRVPKG